MKIGAKGASALLALALLVTSASANAEPQGGAALIEHYQCGRCHVGGPVTPAPRAKNCVACHQAIRDGTFDVKPELLKEWQRDVKHLLEVPSLAHLEGRLDPAWIEAFLIEPHDVRPGLAASMPRFQMSKEDARAIATTLAGPRRSSPAVIEGDVEVGRALFSSKGCTSCHVFSGSGVRSLAPSTPTVPALAALSLAPDLKETRHRFVAENLARWIRDPSSMKPDTLMPALGLTEKEAQDVAAFILRAELSATPKTDAPARLPLLEREVRFDEVEKKVLRKTCWHCHALPDFARGDGGAGNTGGFGFSPRGLDLSSYRGVLSGSRDDHGKRRSIFTPLESKHAAVNGLPRLVAHMVARQYEEAGEPLDDVRGMPLGLPAPTPEEVQLVESWIAQGKKR